MRHSTYLFINSICFCSVLLSTAAYAVDPNFIELSSTEFTFSALQDGVNPSQQLLTITNNSPQSFSWAAQPAGGTWPAWLTIIPSEGLISSGQTGVAILQVVSSGLAAGHYESAFAIVDTQDSSVVATVQVQVEITGPRFDISSNTFSFTGDEAGPNPSDQTLTISNSGGGTLNWSLDLTGKPDWLTLTPVNGSLLHGQTNYVVISINLTGLSGGEYSYSFDVVAPNASHKTVAVNLTVTGPVLSVSETVVSVALMEGESKDVPLTISNSGGGTLNWSLDLIDKPDWLTVVPASGSLTRNESNIVLLSINTIGVADGLYVYQLEVSDSMSTNSPQVAEINLRVGDIHVPAYYPTIQAAIDAAPEGVTIVVSPGIYNEMIDFKDKNIILTSIDPKNSACVESTVITYDRDSVVSFWGNETESCVLRGFTITNGSSILSGGGGIYGRGTHATIAHCVITNNAALYYGYGFGKGGGLYNCDGLIIDCYITDNETYGDGGGLYGCDGEITGCYISGNKSIYSSGGGLYDCNAEITDCIIMENISAAGGGGLYACQGVITDCIIAGNTAVSEGGGFNYCLGTIQRCVITENHTNEHGGGFYNCHGNIKNCLISSNTAAGSGGGLSLSNATIKNCTIVDNTAADCGGLQNCYNIVNSIVARNSALSANNQVNGTARPRYSYVEGWDGQGEGNLDPNECPPLFTDPENGDYHLKSEYGRWDPSISQWVYDTVTSPCIDTGDPNSVEWQNELWPHGGRINMGVYGGTPQASMSPNPVGNIADLDHDGSVGVSDLTRFCEDWLLAEYLLDTDLNRNGVVDIPDFADFANQWLWTEP